MYNWESLNDDKKIVKDLKEKWVKLLNENKSELYYHDFIKENAGMFFFDFDCYLTISKLKLGSEHEVDFVNIKDKYSYGIEYELIEIEKPNSQLFTKFGVPAKDLNNSIQQIRDWKRFLIEDKAFMRKFLPSRNTRILNDSCLKFSIIIGRRSENEFSLQKRNQISKETGVEIRSFDYLTDLLNKRIFCNFPLEEGTDNELDNLLSNPFAKALTDSEWKDFCRNKINTTHFYKNNINEIVNIRNNNNLFNKFK